MEVGDTTLKGKQPEMLTYTDLAKITDNFSEDNYIGNFQFGKFYRGFLDKQHFTVKIWITSKLRNIVLEFRERNLMDELIMLSHQRLVHPCIVGLYGYCRDKENLAVVYNLKSMDSLENILLKDDFTWLQRMKVAFDLACLLAFLHAKRGDLDPFVIRNLSPEHVILDEEYNPKLVDFSMITGGFFPDRQVYSIQPAYGCSGYLDPNLFHDNPINHLATWTSKSDVFAFGLILVSLLSKGAEEMESDMTYLDEWAYRKYKFDKSIIHKSLERDLGFSYVDGEVLSMLAVHCISNFPKGRPSMTKVIDSFLKLQIFNDHKHKELLSVDRYMKKKKRHPSVSLDMRKNKLLLNTEIDYFSCADSKDMQRIDSEALKRYTNNFSEENYIGRFQFGKIFRGLPYISDKGPLFVTVKIWDDYKDLQHNLLRLGDEILLLHHEKYTCHSGMVRMHGYCIEDKYVAIVIFLKPMNSIRNLLPRGDFSWLHRIKAARGVASLLKFLHDVSRHMDPFIIRNLDAAHILLDEEYNPKLVDFGLISGGIFPNRPMYMVKSNLKCHDQVLPAYDISGSWTTKSDVYSFGVLLLCLISKRNMVKPDDGGLPTSKDMEKIHVHKSLQTDSTYNCLDGQEIKRLAVQCVQINPAYRPSMSEIVDALQNLKVIKSNPEFVGLDKISRVNYATNYSNMPKSHCIA